MYICGYFWISGVSHAVMISEIRGCFMLQRPYKIKPQFFDPGVVPPPSLNLPEKFNIKSFTPPSPPVNPPDDKKYAAWSVAVEGEGRARPPVAVRFAGTVVHEKEDPFASDEKKAFRARRLKKKNDKNEETLKKAIFILSQSPTGRALLEDMTKAGYTIVFDNRHTDKHGASGLCDPNNKKIFLHTHDNAEYLALLLGHESVHAIQNTRQNLFPNSHHTPQEGIKVSFAIEADAYAQQTQIALELSYGDPDGPPDQIRFKEPVRQMRERFPDIVLAAERVMYTDVSLQNGATVAAAFQAFYDNFYLRTFYEDSHIEWVNSYAPKTKSILPWLQKHFTKDADSDWIKKNIQHKGVPYLEKHMPHLNFNDARYAGVSEKTAERVEKFYEEFFPKEKPPALKVYGMHMKDAVSWVLGLKTSVHMIITRGKEPVQPPRRPPPPAA